MPQTLIENATLVTMDGRRRVIEGGTLLIEGDRIAAVGAVDPKLRRTDAEVIDAAGKLVLPGLVNSHVHLSQQLARGLADDVDLLTWLRRRVWPYESSLTPEDSHVSALACCLELIRSGVTCFAEAGGQEVDGMGRAVTEAGLRAILCQSTMDCGEGLPARWVKSADECLALQDRHFERWHGQADGRLRVWYGLRTLFNCSDDLVRRTTERAAGRGVGVNMHLAEVIDEVRHVQAARGATPVRHMARLGALGPRLLAVHMVWPDAVEIDLLLRHDVKVSHNPAAAMRVLGFAPVPEMLAKGICVGLGTDGAPCNNRMDLIDEMWLATLIHKGRNLDPTLVPAERVLAMATIDGARCLAWDGEIGSLEAGKKADLIILDPKRPGSWPLHDPVGGVVNAMHASNVVASMCDGRWLMRGGRVLVLDEEAILEEAQRRALAIRARAGITLPPRNPPPPSP
jgi:5-methylthioadenosine/S-adenosylhomocysteine deaminase